VKKIEVGVRPATRDRQPFLGVHPQHQHLAIFNGFGAKGSLMIPWFSQQMCHYLLHHQVLSDEADIRRFPSP
jgi:glycine/D-amino acid oxidase-like deaminating enzyme